MTATGPRDIVPGRRAAHREQQGKRKKRRRRRRIALVAFGVVVFLVAALVGVAYATAKVPRPGQLRLSQSSTIYYSDGRTVMTRLGAENRTEVPLSQVPIDVQHAVIAAENRGFYSDHGISPTGIGRAVWADVRGKDVQGGSTITQQYVKNAYLTDQRTLTRKLNELVLAVKLDRTYSKSQILQWYLNTIYFGRGAYGIQAAAQTYFGVPVSKLTVAQGAVLAASIRSPAGYDPQNHPAVAKARFDYVLSGMVTKKWLTVEKADATSYPKVLLNGQGSGFNDLAGPEGYVVGQVEGELARHGISEDELRRGGLRVVTSIDARAQAAAEKAVADQLRGQPAGLRTALAAVRPGSGAVVAYYGGDKGYGFYDYANHPYQSGSAIKAYVLATALEQGISVNSSWNGSSPQYFPDRPGKPVYNSGDGMGEQCWSCTLARATAMSLNTVYYALTSKVGAKNAGLLAAKAGIRTINGEPAAQVAPRLTNNFGIGEYGVTPLDQADGYATFAAQGVHYAPYFVQQVTRADGSRRYAHVKPAGQRAFSASTAADADYAMQQVITREPIGGRFDRRLSGPDGQVRPAAAKTGTTQLAAGRNSLDNKDAWMVGYAPQLATAVWLGHDRAQKLVDKDGREVYGIGIPAKVWRQFMDAALAGSKVVGFPTPTLRGSRDAGDSGGLVTSPSPPPPPASTSIPPSIPPSVPPSPPSAPAPTTSAPAPPSVAPSSPPRPSPSLSVPPSPPPSASPSPSLPPVRSHSPSPGPVGPAGR